MGTMNVLVSLITQDNDYQRAQAEAAEIAAKQLGISIQIVYADSDAVNQSQQILAVIQSKDHRVDAVVTEPVGTGMVQVAEAAVKAGMGWVIMNREVDYIAHLRGLASVPTFEIGIDQLEVGRIHAMQFAALLPRGGTLLYIEGPSNHSAAKLRSDGLLSRKAPNIQLKTLKGNWTEDSGYKAVNSWLKLSTSKSAGFSVVASQNDAMAVGARKAFSELKDSTERAEWLRMPFTGCDGIPETGQQYVHRGFLTATVITPPVVGMALEMLVRSKRSGVPVPERTLAAPKSFPTIEELRPQHATA
jgi:ABC-type sugar transport system substrate-binding protein